MSSRLTIALGGLVAVAVVIVGCSGSGSMSPSAPTSAQSPAQSPAPSATADVTITITGMNGSNSFSPNPAAVKAGQTVAWRNADNITHTATANNGSFDTGNIAPGATSSPITMSAAASISYRCKLHPDMVGSLNVTGDSGSGGY